MKKHIFIITLILALSAIISVNCLKSGAQAFKERVPTSSTEAEEFYTLKDHNGRIALFRSGEDKPKEIYDIFTDSLPQADSEKIKMGITATEDEIKKLLADYTS